MGDDELTIETLAILATADPDDPTVLDRVLAQTELDRENRELNRSAERAGLNLRF